MRFQVGSQGWPVTGQHSVPPSTLIDLTKDPDNYTTWEQLCVGKVPDPSATALDADCAVAMWRNTHPEHRHRLRRKLDPFNEQAFQRLLEMDEAALARHWPAGRG
jgi:hypothetical protein